MENVNLEAMVEKHFSDNLSRHMLSIIENHVVFLKFK